MQLASLVKKWLSKNETFLLTLSHCVLLSILYTTFITICPTLFNSKTKSALLENGDISVGFLETPFPFSTKTQEKEVCHTKESRPTIKKAHKGTHEYCFGLQKLTSLRPQKHKERTKPNFDPDQSTDEVWQSVGKTNCYLSFSKWERVKRLFWPLFSSPC